MRTIEKISYRKCKIENPIGSDKWIKVNTYNYLLKSWLCHNTGINVFIYNKIEDINNSINDKPNYIVINFEIDDSNCDIFYDFLRSLRETRKILIKNCSSEIIIENICEIANFVPDLITIHSPDSGCIYKCGNLEEKMLNIRNKKYKSANK